MKVSAYPVKRTLSVCPRCGRRIPARIVRRGGDWYIEKTCPEHGDFSCVVWRGKPDLLLWDRYRPSGPVPPGCPDICGESGDLCPGHLRSTCCVLIEITDRCDLGCPYCFARAGEGGGPPERTPEELFEIFSGLCREGRSFIQLSGGEPAVRDDLPEIIAAAKRAGASSVQLNSNGLRLGREPDFARRCAQAGLDFVFLQFDGVTDDVYMKLRGRPLLREKLDAIAVLDSLNVGVTLVPTVAPGVNDGQLGDILRFGLSRSPAVRGVHFQPVSYFGRTPAPPTDADRITMPEVITAITEQTGGLIRSQDLVPSSCDHPRCGFHGDFVAMPEGLLALTPEQGSCCCHPGEDAALKNRRFVARRWKRSGTEADADGDMTDMSVFLARVRRNGFTVTGMAFQDAMNIDLERLCTCSLHVWRDGKLRPFCANYLW